MVIEQNKKNAKWYAVHTYVGCEEAVVKYLKQRIESSDLNNKIFDVIVPKEKKIRVRGGKKEEIEEKIYPGYVLVNMIMDTDTWYIVRNTPKVTGFIGADKTKPLPLSQTEVDELLGKMSLKETKFNLNIQIGDLVKIIDGPFKGQEGKIIDLDINKGRVKVLVPIFGRDTQVELDSLQVHKI
ncbi:MAG: transcription termination/antitermination protein NusG [Minisyncoccia bacterium]